MHVPYAVTDHSGRRSQSGGYLPNWIVEEQSKSSSTIVTKNTIGGVEQTEVAVDAMMNFVDRLDLFKDTAENYGKGRADLLNRMRTRFRDGKP